MSEKNDVIILQGYMAYHRNEPCIPPHYISKEDNDRWVQGWLNARNNYIKE